MTQLAHTPFRKHQGFVLSTAPDFLQMYWRGTGGIDAYVVRRVGERCGGMSGR